MATESDNMSITRDKLQLSTYTVSKKSKSYVGGFCFLTLFFFYLIDSVQLELGNLGLFHRP